MSIPRCNDPKRCWSPCPGQHRKRGQLAWVPGAHLPRGRLCPPSRSLLFLGFQDPALPGRILTAKGKKEERRSRGARGGKKARHTVSSGHQGGLRGARSPQQSLGAWQTPALQTKPQTTAGPLRAPFSPSPLAPELNTTRPPCASGRSCFSLNYTFNHAGETGERALEKRRLTEAVFTRPNMARRPRRDWGTPPPPANV